jgi:hypothetical protein
VNTAESSPPAASLCRVAVTLKLLHLWGVPQEWTFEDEDEDTLTRMLGDLDEFKADTRSKRAVLVAEKDGKIVGTWTHDGVRRLASTIVAAPSSPQWLEVRHVLEDAASGP